jgi:phage host-nuclease inhibitor protein Gam
VPTNNVIAAAASASPPDISAILTSLGVFSLAVAAVVSGIYKGVKEVKKGGADTGKEVGAAIIMDRSSINRLVDSNDKLAAVQTEVISTVKTLDRNVERLTEATQDSRETTRSQIEEQHRLRAATVDLVEITRRIPPR